MITRTKAEELKQAQDALLWIAELLKECPECGGTGKMPPAPWGNQDTCCHCHGTVARFPQLRDVGGHWCCLTHEIPGTPQWCCQATGIRGCQGRGWRPVSIRDGAAELRKLVEFTEVYPRSTRVYAGRFNFGDIVIARDDEVAVILAFEKMLRKGQ